MSRKLGDIVVPSMPAIVTEVDGFDRLSQELAPVSNVVRDAAVQHKTTIKNRGYKSVRSHTKSYVSRNGKRITVTYTKYRREHPIGEGLVYDDGGPGHRKGGGGPPSPNADATKYWKEHNSNHFILQHFHKHGTANEKMQAAKELPKAESKMKFWERHPNFNRKEADKHTSDMKKQWSSVKEDTSEDEFLKLYRSGHEHDRTTGTMRKVKHYNIVKKSVSHDGKVTHTVVGKAATRKGAVNSVNKRDNDYGAYAHSHVPVFEDTVREDTNSMGAPKKLRDVINNKIYMGNTQDEQDILDDRNSKIVKAPDPRGNGDDVYGGGAVKHSNTRVNTAAVKNGSDMYEDWNEGELEAIDESNHRENNGTPHVVVVHDDKTTRSFLGPKKSNGKHSLTGDENSAHTFPSKEAAETHVKAWNAHPNASRTRFKAYPKRDAEHVTAENKAKASVKPTAAGYTDEHHAALMKHTHPAMQHDRGTFRDKI